MIAVISDIHGNLQALEAVLADMGRFPVHAIHCLGDIVGYGAHPGECLDIVASRCNVAIMGDHELTLWDQPPVSPSPQQAASIERTRHQINSMGASDARWEFMWSLRQSFTEGRFLFVHGSPRQPTYEYVFPEDQYNLRKMEDIFDTFESCCVVGHTHLPGVFSNVDQFLCPEDCGMEYVLTNAKALVNVGSVGYPRDSDPRACYVLLDGDRIIFRRVDH